jgi:hypothetical protein
MDIHIGTIIGSPLQAAATHVLSDDPQLEARAPLTCLLADVEKRYACSLTYPTSPTTAPATVPASSLARHCFIAGPTGYGKSRLMRHLTTWMLGPPVRASAIIAEPRLSTILEYASTARRLNIPAERVFLLSPSVPGAVPRWPAFDRKVAVRQMVTALVDVLENSSGIPNANRRRDYLMLAGILSASNGPDFSVDEMLMALQRSEAREALWKRVTAPPDEFAWTQAERSLEELRGLSRGAISDGMAAATRLMRELTSGELCYGTLCPDPREDKPKLRIEEFWQTQSLLLVHLDADVLGSKATSLLAGLILKSAFAAAKSVAKPERPVVATLDEMVELSRFVSDDISRLVSQARASCLHVIAAAQFATQIQPVSLRQSLLKQTALQATFRTDFEEAEGIAESLVAGLELPVSQVEISPVYEEGSTRHDRCLRKTTLTIPIRDANDQPLRIGPHLWKRVKARYAPLGIPVEEVIGIASLSRIPRLYVRDPGTNEPIELRQYLESLRPCYHWLDGPSLSVTVVFPRVKARLTRLNRGELAGVVARAISTLPLQTALIRLDNRLQGIVRIADVPDVVWGPEDEEYLRKVIAINGQSSADILEALRWRTRRMQELMHGGPLGPDEGSTDASTW